VQTHWLSGASCRHMSELGFAAAWHPFAGPHFGCPPDGARSRGACSHAARRLHATSQLRRCAPPCDTAGTPRLGLAPCTPHLVMQLAERLLPPGPT
jgi:hypothetical protein